VGFAQRSRCKSSALGEFGYNHTYAPVWNLSCQIMAAMAKILSNGRFWGGNSRISDETRGHVIKLLKMSELPMTTIARRFGLSTQAVSTINADENYIRPKAHRPPRF